jgi:hypothetical protein
MEGIARRLRSRPQMATERIPSVPRHIPVLGRTIERRGVVFDRTAQHPSEGVMADICLGVTVASLYALVAMGLMIAFI